ncbi:hypothetical protein ABW20_dc0110598 [Dactylellina cionopaga]|nr:hypothetical protein ABW20_dc0110598 [Dactylellina cionopaga]
MKYAPLCSTIIWVAVLSSHFVLGRWLELQQWKRTLSLRPNVETGDVTEGEVTTTSYAKFNDFQEVWLEAGCANGVVSNPGSLLRTIRYNPSNPNPQWPFILSAIEVHDGDDCDDPNSVFVQFPSPEEWPEGNSQGGIVESTIDTQQPSWVPPGQTLAELLNAPTIADDEFEQSQAAFDEDVNTNNVYNNRQPELFYEARANELQDFLDETTPTLSKSENEIIEETINQMGNDQVMEPETIPQEDSQGEGEGYSAPVLEVNMLEYGYRFGDRTSIRFISDLSQWYTIDGGFERYQALQTDEEGTDMYEDAEYPEDPDGYSDGPGFSPDHYSAAAA